MMTAMLRFAGLNANPVLVSSKGNGIPLFPTADGFDYVISMVTFPNNSYVLLDATEPYSEPNMLPLRALNWNGRVILDNGSSSWVKLQSSKPAIQENILMVKLNEDLALEGLARTTFKNLNALSYRRSKNHLKKEQLISEFEENNALEIENFKVLNKLSMGKPVLRNIKFFSEDLVEEINNKVYLDPLLFLAKKKNPFKLEERKFPIDFATPWEDKDRVTIEIPEGYKVEFIPEAQAVALPDNIGVFKYQIIHSGNKIKTFASLKFNKSLIPAQYYPYLKDFYSKLVEKESEKIVLVKI